MKKYSWLWILFGLSMLVGCLKEITTDTQPQGSAKTNTPQLTASDAADIAKEAYIYGFPMVMNYKALYTYAIDEPSPDYKGPFNQMACEARLFTPRDKAVVTPNADTPYCMFWMDLRSEPLVLTVPEMEPKRLYHFQLIDLYTHNLAYVGTLTTGNGAGTFLIAGPTWKGPKPEGISQVIRTETEFIFNVTRTQLFGPDDLKHVETIQQSYALQPLSTFLGTQPPVATPLPDFPAWVEGAQFDERFFSYLDFMMSLLKNPGEGEKPLWDDLARLGIGPRGTFDIASLPPEVREALKDGANAGFHDMEAFIQQTASDPLASAKLFGTREFLTQSAKTHYGLESPSMLRAVAAHMGLFGNSAAEAIYPTYLVDSDKHPLDASTNHYTLTFEKGQLPPVKAFWSLTMYDGLTQLFIDNPHDRYLLNSTMMNQFKLEKDGSCVLHIAKEPPAKEYEPNWLPAPNGPFYMVMRLYGPESAALDGHWMPPAVKKAH